MLRSRALALGCRGSSPKPPCASLLLVLTVLTLRVLGSVVQRAVSFGPVAGGCGSRNEEADASPCLLPPAFCFNEVTPDSGICLTSETRLTSVSAAVNTNADFFCFLCFSVFPFSSSFPFEARGSELLIISSSLQQPQLCRQQVRFTSASQV